eukprot:20198-Chlamydomonas_euryale.AAC.4
MEQIWQVARHELAILAASRGARSAPHQGRSPNGAPKWFPEFKKIFMYTQESMAPYQNTEPLLLTVPFQSQYGQDQRRQHPDAQVLFERPTPTVPVVLSLLKWWYRASLGQGCWVWCPTKDAHHALKMLGSFDGCHKKMLGSIDG